MLVLQTRKSLLERGVGVLSVALLIGAALTVAYWSTYHSLPTASAETRVYKISCYMWQYYPSEITVRVGDTMILDITSLDVPHGVYFEHWDIVKDLPYEKTVEVVLKADTVGVFQFYCSLYCGVDHDHMKGEIIVEP